MRTGGDEVLPVDHFAADEATRDVGVDRLRRIERRRAAAQSPGSRLLLTSGEERDQVQRVTQPADNLFQRRAATVTKRRRILFGQLRQLGLERQVDPAGPVLDRDQRHRRQRLEPVGQLAWPFAERLLRVDVREHLLEHLNLGAQLHVTRLRLLHDPLQPLLDMVAVGDEQLELQVLQVAGRISPGREAVEHDEQRVDLAQVSEQRGPGPRNVLNADRRRRDLLRVHDLRQRIQPRIGDRSHADVRLAVFTADGLRQRGEERRLP